MSNEVSPLHLADVTSFDVTTDVLVVGFGAAGTCATHAAREAGAEVLVAERTSGPGGAAALSEGIVYLGGGTPVQQACGFEDSVDNLTRYLLAACGPDPDAAKVVAYAEASTDHFDWLVSRGVEYDARLDEATQMAPAGTEGLVWSGRRERLAVQRDRRPGSPGPPGQDPALDRVVADADPGRCRRLRRPDGLLRHAGRAADRR